MNRENREQLIQLVGRGDSPYSLINEMMAATATSKSNHVSSRSEREELEKQRRTQIMIRQNICPICGGKLSRGKKNKHNGYKRTWTCTNCSSIYTI
jgi:uncharacterized protein with PIN domain